MTELLSARPGEVYVSCTGLPGDRWPAVVDFSDRWNGWLSPQFRPVVARALAAWQASQFGDDPEQDQLVLAPDGRTLVHLVYDEDAPDADPLAGVALPRENAVWAVYPLVDDAPPCYPAEDRCAGLCGLDTVYCQGRVKIGAWHWTWYQVEE
jgi:hypothetical protein